MNVGRGKSVFLSYAREDRARLQPLAAALEAAGLDLWWDDRIAGGQAFAQQIELALGEAGAVIVAWSAASVRSDWVRDEAARGRDRGCLVPITFDGARAPLGFGQIHAIDFSNWRGLRDAPEFERLLGALAACDEGEVHGRQASATAGVDRRRVLAGIGAAGAVGAAAGAWWLAGRPGLGGGAPGNSIAVLPFKNLSGDPAQAYFSDGVAEEVRAMLGRLPSLSVAAQTSSAKFRDAAETATRIAAQLGVAFLLSGSVRRAGDTVRVAVELVDGDKGFSRWSETYDRRLDDIFAVQSEIASSVAGALEARMADDADEAGRTVSAAAYDEYLRGRALFHAALDEAEERDGLAALTRATELDPRFALAHAWRARSLAAIANFYLKGSARLRMLDQAVSTAHRAVAVGPDVADAQLALGFTLFNNRLDVRGSRAPYARALRLGQGNADVLLLCAVHAARVGEGSTAQAAVARAVRLDRLNPRAHRAQGTVHMFARRYDAALVAYRQALRLYPELEPCRAHMGACLLHMGRPEEAAAEFAAETDTAFRLTGLAIANAALRKPDEARRAFATLVAERGDAALYQQAQVQARWGAAAAALGTLRRAYEARDAGLTDLAVDRMLDGLRPEPAFRKLATDIGFV